MAMPFDPFLARRVKADTLEPCQQVTSRGFKTATDFRLKFMLKHPRLSEFHSYAEYLHAGLLEGDPHVISYTPQPYRLFVGNRRYPPDCHVVYDSGSRKIFELKPGGQFPDELRIPLEHFFAQYGMVFEVISNESVFEREIEAENWLEIVTILYQSRLLSTENAEAELLERLSVKGPCTLGDLIDPGDRQNRYYREIALFRLLHRGHLQAALTARPLDWDTEVALFGELKEVRSELPSPPDLKPQDHQEAPITTTSHAGSLLPLRVGSGRDAERITWRERLEQQPSLWQFANWPVIPLDAVPKKRQRQFFRNQQIIARVLALSPIHKVAREFSVSDGLVSQLLERSLGGTTDLPPALTSSLIPFQRIGVPERKSPLPTMQTPSGSACALQALFKQLPRVRAELDAFIEAKLKDAPNARRLTPQAFHKRFKHLLAEAHWPSDCYPYTSPQTAYESIRLYLHQRKAEQQQARQSRRSYKPRNLGIDNRAFSALRAIQIDEHTIDLHERIHLILNDRLIPLRVARATLLVAVDVDTHCVLGFYFAPTEVPSQQDLLTLLDQCLKPWEPIALQTPGFAYTSGACFPSGLKPGFPISFGTVQLDNAWMHRANSIIDLLAVKGGATLSYGVAKIPEVRQLVESVFRYINQHLSHDDAATTGSYPTDPIKESRKNQKKPPLITFETVNEALSLLLTEYNTTPIPPLGGASPLALFRHHYENHFGRYVPSFLSEQWQPLLGEAEVKLHWYGHEGRFPHINLFHARYQGQGLLSVAHKEKRIRVKFNREDIRTLEAYTLNGQPLGILQVQGGWQRYPHSVTTRNWLFKHAKDYRLAQPHILDGYVHHLLDNMHMPGAALSLLHIVTDFTGGTGGPLMLDEKTSLQTTPTHSSRFSWHTSMANRGE